MIQVQRGRSRAYITATRTLEFLTSTFYLNYEQRVALLLCNVLNLLHGAYQNRTDNSTLQALRDPFSLMPRSGQQTIAQTCVTCKQEFQAVAAEVRRGNGKFCSLACSARNPARKKPKVPNTLCTFCQKPLYRTPSQLKRSKHGKVFCDRSCKESAQKDVTYGISPAHYGTGEGKYAYRALALSSLPNECNKCGYNKCVKALQVHHRDHDRANNALENLEILCPTCHVEHHIDCKRTL